jgi:hypothetical protein
LILEGNINDFQVFTSQVDYDLVVVQLDEEIRLIKVTDIQISMQTEHERRCGIKKTHSTEVLAQITGVTFPRLILTPNFTQSSQLFLAVDNYLKLFSV